jgi:GNAT superfamily N-acetyltransferase
VSSVRPIARDLWCLLCERGAKAAWSDVREILRRRLYMKTDQLIVRKQLSPAEPGASHTVEVVDAEPRHLPLLAEINRRECNTSRTRHFEKGLAEGRSALLGFRDGRLIGWFWWHDRAQGTDGFELSRFGLELAADEVYGYDLFIVPDERGRGRPAQFLAGVEAALARHGYRRMFGFVESWNRPARWLYATSGYEVVMRCQTRTILRRLMFVDGRGWLLAGKRGLRPLTIASLGRRS